MEVFAFHWGCTCTRLAALGDGQGGQIICVGGEQNRYSLCRIRFETTHRTELFLAKTRFEPSIMGKMPAEDIITKYC